MAAVGLLGLRAFLSPLPASAFLAFALLPIGASVGIVLALRRTPSRCQCAALADEASHAGGLLLVADLPGADAWPVPPTTVPPIPSHLRRQAIRCSLACLALLAVAFAPDRWFASSQHSLPRPSLADLTTDLKNELDQLAEEEKLDPGDLETIREELARVEAAADPTEPGATLDALERLQDRVHALLDLNAETLKRLIENNVTPNTLALSPETAKALHDMIDDSGMGHTLKGEESPGEGEGEGEGQGQGGGGDEGDGFGNGGVSRGREDAPMKWGAKSEMDGSRFADRTQEANPTKADTAKTGESISEEDPAKYAPSGTAYGSSQIGGRSTGVSVQHTVSPRHRGTVKRFFETERKTP